MSASRREQGELVALALALSALCAWIVPITRDQSHVLRLALASLLAAALLLRPWWERMEGGRAFWHRFLVAALVVGSFNYYRFDREQVLGIGDVTDTAYYYLNSKYFDELGYADLYPAMLVADRDGQKRHAPELVQFRDSADDVVKPIAVAFERGERLQKERFSPERWRSFGHDADWFLRRLSRRSAEDNFFVDHGYNPPPTWTILGAPLASACPVEWVGLITQVDLILVLGAFLAVALAAGPEVGALVFLFFLCSFSGRWPVVGQSLLRFDWWAGLMLAWSGLVSGRGPLTGAGVVLATTSRVFPGIFLFPLAVSALIERLQSGRWPAQARAWLGAGALTGGLLFSWSLARYGLSSWESAIENLALHARSFSSHRVGLGSLLVWRGELDGESIRAAGGLLAKELQVQALRPALVVSGGLACLALGGLAFRRRIAPDFLFALALVPLFCLTNAQIGYYMVRTVMIAALARRVQWPAARILLAGWFLVEVVAQVSKVLGWERYATTSLTSWGVGLLLTATLVLVAHSGWGGFARWNHADEGDRVGQPG